MPMEISPLLRRCLDATIAELTAEFRGVFSRETVIQLAPRQPRQPAGG